MRNAHPLLRHIGFIGCMVLVGCGSSDNTDSAAGSRDSLTQHQRDSVLGASRLPGARPVQRALDVADSANARAARMDSLQQ
jgi:hypothetical protein